MLEIKSSVVPDQLWFKSVALAMRNPMNSWDKSDTAFKTYGFGDNDLELAKKLVKAGTSDRKFMRMIPVLITVNAPIYWWKEFDTYKVGTVRNSCSTMHKIMAQPFEIDDFSFEIDNSLSHDTVEFMYSIVAFLNRKRNEWLAETDPVKKKKIWYTVIRCLPESYNQRATLMLNYETLSAIYSQRKGHKLNEWHTFCDWIKTLPHSELITQEDN